MKNNAEIIQMISENKNLKQQQYIYSLFFRLILKSLSSASTIQFRESPFSKFKKFIISRGITDLSDLLFEFGESIFVVNSIIFILLILLLFLFNNFVFLNLYTFPNLLGSISQTFIY